MKVLFVGSNPSKRNLKTEEPFIGTQSHKTLLKWIKALGVTDYTLINASNDLEAPLSINPKLEKAMAAHDVVIALGSYATDIVIDLAPEAYFLSLPHPSPKNRLLNDKALIAARLANVKAYLKAL